MNYSWNSGAFHTSIAVNGPILIILKMITGFTQDVMMLFAKALQCFWGLALISIIADKTHRWYVPKASRSFFYITAFSSAVILPVINLALHTINYDVLSMTLGVLSVVMLGAGFRFGKLKYFAGSVIIAALATQEKLIASPVLFLCTLAFASRLTLTSGSLVRDFLSALKASAISVLCGSSVFLLSNISLIIVRNGNTLPGNVFGMIFQPYFLILWPMLRFFNKAVNLISIPLTVEIALLLSFICILALFSIVLPWIIENLKRNRFLNIQDCIVLVVKPVKFGLLLVMIVIGTAATFLMKAQVTPLVPVRDGYFTPILTFNGVCLSYGAKTYAGHIAASVAWSCATFVNAFPSVILLTIFLAWAIHASGYRRSEVSIRLVYHEIVAVISLICILLFGALQLPLIPRYMNLFYFLFLISGVIDIALFNFRLTKLKRILFTTGLLLLIIEVLPFRPALVTFRPFWSNMPAKFNTDPAYGQVPPWCTGWGEEVMLAGKRIYEEYGHECGSKDEIRIFHNYSGSWVKKPANVNLVFMAFGFDDYKYEKCDYYVFTRSGTTFSFIPFPSQVEPLFTIDSRGIVKAWVFRAGDLRAAGIKFQKNLPQTTR